MEGALDWHENAKTSNGSPLIGDVRDGGHSALVKGNLPSSAHGPCSIAVMNVAKTRNSREMSPVRDARRSALSLPAVHRGKIQKSVTRVKKVLRETSAGGRYFDQTKASCCTKIEQNHNDLHKDCKSSASRQLRKVLETGGRCVI